MDGEPLEPLNIDDRSPGEKMLASGRVSVVRIGELIDEQRLDIAALIWMLCTAAFVCVEIYSALDIFGAPGFNVSSWDKIAALGQTGGPLVAVSCLVGILLALTWDSTLARFSILLAGIVGAWVFVAGFFDLAASAHNNTGARVSFGGPNRLVGAIGGLALAGLGLVVMMIAWRSGSVANRSEPAPEIS